VALDTLCLGPAYRRPKSSRCSRTASCASIHAHHRRIDRGRGGAIETTTRSWPGCTAAWSSARAPWATAASWLRRSILFHREPQHLHQAREPFRKFAASVPASCAASISRWGPTRVSLHHWPVSRSTRQTCGGVLADDWCASTPSTDERTRSTGSCSTPPAKPRAFRCSTTRRSISSASAGLHAARRRAQLLLLRHRRHVRRQLLPPEVAQEYYSTVKLRSLRRFRGAGPLAAADPWSARSDAGRAGPGGPARTRASAPHLVAAMLLCGTDDRILS